MTEHEPECPCIDKAEHPDGCLCCEVASPCICDRLRACEQRVRNQDIATHHADLKEAKALLASRDEAWFAGVDAAREAVAALRTTAYESSSPWQRALSAIDALREDSND